MCNQLTRLSRPLIIKSCLLSANRTYYIEAYGTTYNHSPDLQSGLTISKECSQRLSAPVYRQNSSHLSGPRWICPLETPSRRTRSPCRVQRSTARGACRSASSPSSAQQNTRCPWVRRQRQPWVSQTHIACPPAEHVAAVDQVPEPWCSPAHCK